MTNKEKYHYRKENNICTKCGKAQPEEGKTKCRECAEKVSKEQMDNYYFLKDMGICVKCRKEKADNGYTTCILCRIDDLEKNKQQYANSEENRKRKCKMRKDRYERLKEQGLFVICGNQRDNPTLRCDKCRKKEIIHKRRKRYQNAGISRSERPNYEVCYICGFPICKESKKLCERCLESSRKNLEKAHENPTPGMLEQRERWKMDNRLAFGWKVTYEEMKTS